MSTGNKWKAVAAAAGFAFTIFFTGCGGGDDEPASIAPASLESRSYNIFKEGRQSAVSFVSQVDYTFLHENGVTDQGIYEALRNGNAWTFSLINTNGGKETYTFYFSTSVSGDFRLHRDGEAEQTGTFAARSTAVGSGDPSSTGSTTGTTTSTGTTTTGASTTGPGTTTGPQPSNEYNGFAPVSIVGRMMFGTRTTANNGGVGQTHEYTFGNGTFHDSDPPEESDGQFTYVAGRSSATLTLNYQSPREFYADRHQITMTFTAKDRGTFQSTYTRGDGAMINIAGTFQFTPIQ